MINDREKTMAILLRNLSFNESEFNTYWKLGLDILEEIFLVYSKE